MAPWQNASQPVHRERGASTLTQVGVIRTAFCALRASVAGAVELVGEGITKVTEAPEYVSEFLPDLWNRGGWHRPLAAMISPVWLLA